MREYKFAILGTGGVGKSALTLQFVQDKFVETYDPTLEDLYRKHEVINGKECLLELLDTAGSEQFTLMIDQYIKNNQGFVLVYSINSRASFDELVGIKDQISLIKDSESVPIILVGNKSDLKNERVISFEQGRKLGEHFNCTFLETSAKNKINIHDIFYDLVAQVDAKQAKPYKKRKLKCKFL